MCYFQLSMQKEEGICCIFNNYMGTCNNMKHTVIIYRRKFLILVGGRSQTENYQKKVHKFSCKSAVCRWEVMKPEIQYPRKYIVGMFIPNSLVSKSYIISFNTKQNTFFSHFRLIVKTKLPQMTLDFLWNKHCLDKSEKRIYSFTYFNLFQENILPKVKDVKVE